ncbi:MAG: hypothetical protein HYS23_09470 [Geobacter sp.]|nr:hypothetical protein [Geobacter sp.]
MNVLFKVLTMCLFLWIGAGLAMAADAPFRIIYHQDNVNVDETTIAGELFVSVYNGSGGDVKDLIVAIPDPNDITYHNLPILIGSIPNDQMKEVTEHFEAAKAEAAETVAKEVVWSVEYTNPAGERKTVDVSGKKGL